MMRPHRGKKMSKAGRCKRANVQQYACLALKGEMDDGDAEAERRLHMASRKALEPCETEAKRGCDAGWGNKWKTHIDMCDVIDTMYFLILILCAR